MGQMDLEPTTIAARRRARVGTKELSAGLSRHVGGLVDQTGQVCALVADVVVRLPRRPFPIRESLEQTWFVLKVSLLPALLLTLAFGLVIGLEVHGLTSQLGANSAQGAAMVLAIVREAGPLGASFMVAAGGGTAITADLGSRVVRDEIAAMQVMSVDPIHRLVVPRVVATVVASFLMTGMLIVVGLGGGYYFAVVVEHSNAGAYLSGFDLLARMSDLIFAALSAVIFGVAAAVIACWRGLYAKGGPGGVGTAVNRGVVVTLMALVVINLIMTFAYFAIVPQQVT